MKGEVLISIITPVHNCEAFIKDTIQSVQNQTYSYWEWIIVDDCSGDSSVGIITEIANADDRIKLIRNDKNHGPAITRNRGIKAAKGDFLTFIDGDDIWLPNFLEKSLSLCLEKGYEFVFASYQRKNEELEPLICDYRVPDKIGYNDILRSCPISCLTAFIDIRRIGKFYMPNINKRQDWCLWLAILKKVDYAYGIKEPLAIYRMRKDSLSRSKIKLIPYVWMVYRKIEGINFLRSSCLLFHWSFNGFKKYYINR